MTLSQCNQQVAGEVRELLYPRRCFTVEISAMMTFFSSRDFTKPSRPRVLTNRFKPFQPLPLTGYIEHWQFDLQFRAPYILLTEGHRCLLKFGRWERIDVDKIFLREGILEAVAQLAKLDSLGSIKIKFPCRCHIDNTRQEDYGDGWFWGGVDMPDEEVIQVIHDVLEPLKTLYFYGPVAFIAAQPVAIDQKPCDSSKCETRDTQCEQADCLAFVAKFDKLAEFLTRSSLPRTQLSSQHHSWLDIKHQAANLSCGFGITDSLLHLWTRAKFNGDVVGIAPSPLTDDLPRRAFAKAYKSTSANLKAAMEKERIAKAERLKGIKSGIQFQAKCDCVSRLRCTREDREKG